MSQVFLKREENGFGFRIVGGTEEGSQVAIGYVVPGGVADVSGLLHTGDEITTVDGIDVLGVWNVPVCISISFPSPYFEHINTLFLPHLPKAHPIIAWSN